MAAANLRYIIIGIIGGVVLCMFLYATVYLHIHFH